VGSHFRSAGDRIVLLGSWPSGRLGGSAYWAHLLNFVGGEQPVVDLAAESALQRLLVEAARQKLLRSAHDCSAGGLAVTVAEAAMGGPYASAGFGGVVNLAGAGAGAEIQEIALLYGEDHARAVVSCDPAREESLTRLASELGVPAFPVGFVGPERGELAITTPGGSYLWPIDRLREVYFSAIPRRMSHVAEDRGAV
jgi:phosphoribosylformylglycinamidine synthase